VGYCQRCFKPSFKLVKAGGVAETDFRQFLPLEPSFCRFRTGLTSSATETGFYREKLNPSEYSCSPEQ